MTRIYENRGLVTRTNLSAVVVVIALLFGCFELWSGYRGEGNAGTNYLFALFFLGGAAYAVKQLGDNVRDSVISLDADEATGESVILLWRPFGRRKIVAPLARLTDWQYQVRPGRMRVPLLTAHHPDHPRPLEFELTAGAPVSGELRALAPEAVAAFERAVARS